MDQARGSLGNEAAGVALNIKLFYRQTTRVERRGRSEAVTMSRSGTRVIPLEGNGALYHLSSVFNFPFLHKDFGVGTEGGQHDLWAHVLILPCDDAFEPGFRLSKSLGVEEN